MARPINKALVLSDDDLDKLSIVTPADIIKAKQLWRSSVDSKFITLLDAPLVEVKDGKIINANTNG